MEYNIDAKNKILGRLASEIAVILQGKKNPKYDPRLEGDDKVIVKNINKIKLSGRKFSQKVYYRHSGRIGHLRTESLRNLFSKDPGKVLKLAVRRMLPNNSLRNRRMKKLIFE